MVNSIRILFVVPLGLKLEPFMRDFNFEKRNRCLIFEISLLIFFGWKNCLRLNFYMESIFTCINLKKRMFERLRNANERKRMMPFTAILTEQNAASVPFRLKSTLLYSLFGSFNKIKWKPRRFLYIAYCSWNRYTSTIQVARVSSIFNAQHNRTQGSHTKY